MEVLRFRISEAEGLAWSTGIKVYTPMTREANGGKEDEEAVQSNVPTRRARESGHSAISCTLRQPVKQMSDVSPYLIGTRKDRKTRR